MDRGRPSIYGLVDADGCLRYIGKANDPAKRLASHMRDSMRRDTPVYRWIRKNGRPKMVILAVDCEDWKVTERALIAEARTRGDKLLNIADGGDEPFCPALVRAKNGILAAKRRVDTPDKARLYKLKTSLGRALKQGYCTEETKMKMRVIAERLPAQFGDWADI